MNFSTLKGLTIPEGSVKQIADASGRVIWSAVKNVTITITFDGTYNGDAYVTINGESYHSSITLEVPAGTVILCEAFDSKKDYGAKIFLNGTIVDEGNLPEYNYIVPKNVKTVNIQLKQVGTYEKRGEIYITEIPEGYALVTITGSGNATYVIVDGVKYTGTTNIALAVPVGTVINCRAYTDEDANPPYNYATYGNIRVNGEYVGTYHNGSGDWECLYEYVVVGNTNINRTINKDKGNVDITEQ